MNHSNMDHSHHGMNKHSEHDHSHGSIEEQEIKSWKKRMTLAWIFTIPIALLMISERLFEFMLFEENTSIIILLLLGFPVVFITGFETLKGGLRGLFTFYFNMDSLIALGTVIAYLT